MTYNSIINSEQLTYYKKTFIQTVRSSPQNDRYTESYKNCIIRMANEINIEGDLKESLTRPTGGFLSKPNQTIYYATTNNIVYGLINCFCNRDYPLDNIINSNVSSKSVHSVYITHLAGIYGGGSALLKKIIKEALDLKKMAYIKLVVAASENDKTLYNFYKKIVNECSKKCITIGSTLYIYN